MKILVFILPFSPVITHYKKTYFPRKFRDFIQAELWENPLGKAQNVFAICRCNNDALSPVKRAGLGNKFPIF